MQVSEKIEEEFKEKVERIIQFKNESNEENVLEIEKEIDSRIYELYELTEEEIKIVEEGVR